MKSLTASEAKNSFGKLLDLARHEPIVIKKQGREVAVVLSIEEYEKLANLAKTQGKDDRDDLSLDERLKLLKLPPQERATILAESTEKMLSHYRNDNDLRI